MSARQRRAIEALAEATEALSEEERGTVLSLVRGYLRTDSEQFLIAIKYLIGTRTGQARDALDDIIALLLIGGAQRWPEELHQNNKYLLG